MSGGTGGGPGRRGGVGWLVFIAIPPVIVLAGLVALFVWQGAKGGVRGKWQKGPSTNAPGLATGARGGGGAEAGTNRAGSDGGTEVINADRRNP